MKTSKLVSAKEPQVRRAIGLAAEAGAVRTPGRASRIVDRVRRAFVREASLRRGGDPSAKMAQQFEAWG